METTQKPEKTRKPKARRTGEVLAAIEERLSALSSTLEGVPSGESAADHPHILRLRELIDELKRSLGRKDEEA